MADAHGCKQEQTIGEHNALLKMISGHLKELVQVGKQMAQQGEQIIALTHRQNKSEEDIDNLYERVREIEIAPAKDHTTVKHNVVLVVLTAVATFLVAFFTKGWK